MVTRKEFAANVEEAAGNGTLVSLLKSGGGYDSVYECPESLVPNCMAVAMFTLFDWDDPDSVAVSLRFVRALADLEDAHVNWDVILRRFSVRCIEEARAIVVSAFGTLEPWFGTFNGYCDEGAGLISVDGDMDLAACGALAERIRTNHYLPDDPREVAWIVSGAHAVVYIALAELTSDDRMWIANELVNQLCTTCKEASEHANCSTASSVVLRLFAGLTEDLEALVQANNSSKGA